MPLARSWNRVAFQWSPLQSGDTGQYRRSKSFGELAYTSADWLSDDTKDRDPRVGRNIGRRTEMSSNVSSIHIRPIRSSPYTLETSSGQGAHPIGRRTGPTYIGK